MDPTVVDVHINGLFPTSQGAHPHHRHIFLSDDQAFLLGDILGSYSQLYVYHLVTFTNGSRRLVRPNGSCIFNPEQSIDSYGTGPNSLTHELGMVVPGSILKVYSLLDITRLRARKNHVPIGSPGVDLVVVYSDGSTRRLSSAAGDAIYSLYGKLQSAGKKTHVKGFFEEQLNYIVSPATKPAVKTTEVKTIESAWYGGSQPMFTIGQSQFNTAPQADVSFDAFDYKEPESTTELKIDFVLPSKISDVVSGSTLHSVVLTFLSSLNSFSLKSNTYKLFFVVAGLHRGTVGILKRDLGTWLEIDIFDRINARRELVLLGDCEHDPLEDMTDTFVPDTIKVAKCQTIPITYSVVK